MAHAEGFRDFFYTAADGLRLHARLYGAEDAAATPVVCLPGLTRNARDFHRLALHLSQEAPTRRRVVAFDYRGRGRSAYDSNWQNYTVGTELADVLLGLGQLAVERAFFIGTSRGGIIVQVLAAIKPQLIAGAVLNDIGPEIERQGLDHILAYLADPADLASVEDAVGAQKRIHGHAFPALAEEDWIGMVEALYRVENGLPVPDFDPELVRTLTSADPERPLPTLWKEFDALAQQPVLALRGSNSLLLSPSTLAEMGRRQGVETLTVDGQGHAPFLDTGDLPQRIAAFFDAADRGGAA